MYNNKNSIIRCRVARNNLVSERILGRMTEDNDEHVLMCLAFNDALSDAAFKRMLKTWKNMEHRALRMSSYYYKRNWKRYKWEEFYE